MILFWLLAALFVVAIMFQVLRPLWFGQKATADDQIPLSVYGYTDAPLLSGFISEKNLERIRGTAVVNATRMGAGAVIRIIDNLNFRGVWYGTNKLFVNTLFFGGLIKSTRALDN